MMVLLPSLAGAQYFTDTGVGDVDAGFRKTGSFQENYEMVVYLGNISNFLAVAPGVQINITNYTHQQLTNMCPDNLGNLQWSVFASFSPSTGPLVNSAGSWPIYSTWYTVPRSNPGIPTTPGGRLPSTFAANLEGQIISVANGANSLSQTLYSEQGNTNAYNNSLVILEPTADADLDENLTYFISASSDPSFGDFGGNAIDFSVENVTSNSFTSAAVSDFYANVPTGRGDVDPITGSSSGNCDYLGYFTLNPNGTMTFTRASTNAPPSAGSVTASVTNGFGPLTVVFTNSASGTITNWVWNFGNGNIITNTTGASVTNTYAAAGSYSVTLTVYGPGGSSTVTVANYIVASPTPKIGGLALAAGKLVFSGTNCPVGAQYRILTSTNVAMPLADWTPVVTNTFGSSGTFSYTNSISSTNSFFLLVSP
ncbi:MAG TPA: PKD domain-containing protein [Verrucomicrobiae bacterium]|nr:PKD domain-containing protein [Verrucomicrobiae bacterium]